MFYFSLVSQQHGSPSGKDHQGPSLVNIVILLLYCSKAAHHGDLGGVSKGGGPVREGHLQGLGLEAIRGCLSREWTELVNRGVAGTVSEWFCL